MNSQLKSQLLNVLVQKMKQEDNGLTNYYDKATLDKINYLTEEILYVGYVGQPHSVGKIYCEKCRKKQATNQIETLDNLKVYCEECFEVELENIERLSVKRKRVCKKDPDYYYY